MKLLYSSIRNFFERISNLIEFHALGEITIGSTDYPRDVFFFFPSCIFISSFFHSFSSTLIIIPSIYPFFFILCCYTRLMSLFIMIIDYASPMLSRASMLLFTIGGNYVGHVFCIMKLNI